MQGAYALRRPRLRRCGPETHYSFFFDLIDRLFPERWGNNKPLHRLCSLCRKMGATHLTVEDLAPNAEIQDEHDAISQYYQAPIYTQATRISFFRTDKRDWMEIDDNGFLGYAVLLKHSRPRHKVLVHVLESVVRPPTVFLASGASSGTPISPTNYYVHCKRPFHTVVGTQQDYRRFTVEGTFFCQQNGLTHVCAHAALRMAVNSSPTLPVATKLTNPRINQILKLDHRLHQAQQGLHTLQIQRVLSALRLGHHPADFRERLGSPYSAFIYPIVESKLPVILGIESPNEPHVVAVLGHTSNTDRWTPEARQGYGCFPASPYISSASWVDHFIINDDNYGMNITLPTEMIQNFIVPRLNPNLHAAMAIGIMPRGITAFGCVVEESATRLAFEVLAHTRVSPGNRWLMHLQSLARAAQGQIRAGRSPINTIVSRTLRVNKEQYIDHLGAEVDSYGDRIQHYESEFLSAWLPDVFWLTEISLPDLYTANKHKLGDVISIVDPSLNALKKGENSPFLWFPGMAMWFGKGWNAAPWSLAGHVPLLRPGAAAPPPLEW